jgi:XTP/dITP diphosphohydrolase
MNEKLKAFDRLLNIMDELREKCPWDRKQTIESLRHLTIEEMYELAEAIINKDFPEIKKELGDILLHIVFYAKIASETNDFDIADVINALCDKLIFRHPHIYGDVEATTEEQVKENWEKLKLKEGNKSILAGVPAALPAIVKAYRIQEKTKAVGFEWENKEQVWEKVEEELQEFKEEIIAGDKNLIENEYGDLLFSLINYGRFIGVNPEDALERTNQKFIKRFKYIEDQALLSGRKMEDMTLLEMDKLWNEAKSI